MKRKVVFLIIFLISMIPIGFPQYGGQLGVSEIKGYEIFCTPIGVLSLLVVIIGIFISFGSAKINRNITLAGLIGIVASELWMFIIWPTKSFADSISLSRSLDFVFVYFWIQLAASILAIGIYIFVEKKYRVDLET